MDPTITCPGGPAASQSGGVPLARRILRAAALLGIIGLFGSESAKAQGLVLAFTDPVGDHCGRIDVTTMRLAFDKASGAYTITLRAGPASPFLGAFRVNVNLFNPDTGTTAQNPSFFADNLNDFDLAAPMTTLTLTGVNPRLTSWNAGDRVAPATPPLGNPEGLSSFRSSVLDLPIAAAPCSPELGFDFDLAQDNVAFGSFSIIQTDSDSDTLADAFETQFGLDPGDATGSNGAAGDPDGDGKTNAEEQDAGTHPRGLFTRYFAEGATAGNLAFRTRIATANPGTTAAKVLYRFQKTDGTTVSHFIDLAMMTRHPLDVGSLAGLADAEFSIICESAAPVVSDRTMEWDADGYGSHAETAIPAPALTWHLAEGSTNGFNLFYLVQNPNGMAASISVRFLRPGGVAPLVRTFTVAAHSRFNLWVNTVDPELSATDVSAVLASTNGVSIIVERAMYLDLPGQPFGAGHEAAGVTTAALGWFFAEGATGSFFDLFLLLMNPSDIAAQVRADYLLPGGALVTKTYTVAANSRLTIWVDLEDGQLADTAVSTAITVTNGVAIVAERAMWWNAVSGVASWFEAHASAGSTVTGTRWALAEGEVGGVRGYATFILIANTSAFAGSATVKLLFEDGTTQSRTFALAAHSRFNVDVGAEFPGAMGRRFGAVITSQVIPNGTEEIVVERAMYSDALGGFWAAGTSAPATKLQTQGCFPDLPSPRLAVGQTEAIPGSGSTRYRIPVTNWNAFPDILFEAAPDLPPCGLNTSAIWFASDVEPSPAVYITLTDRRCGISYTSNVVQP